MQVKAIRKGKPYDGPKGERLTAEADGMVVDGPGLVRLEQLLAVAASLDIRCKPRGKETD